MLCYGYDHTQKIQSNIYIIILKMPQNAIHLKQDIQTMTSMSMKSFTQ